MVYILGLRSDIDIQFTINKRLNRESCNSSSSPAVYVDMVKSNESDTRLGNIAASEREMITLFPNQTEHRINHFRIE